MAKQTLKFFRVSSLPTSGNATKGGIYFNTGDSKISVCKAASGTASEMWDTFGGSDSNVTDASFASNVLTINRKEGGDLTLDFSDVASAGETKSLLSTLRDSINAIYKNTSGTETGVLVEKIEAVEAHTINGKALSDDPSINGADIKLNGYSKPAATGTIAETDTVNQALGKLEKGLEAAVSGGVTSILEGNGIKVDATLVNTPTVSVDFATDSEATTGTSEVKAVNPKQLKVVADAAAGKVASVTKGTDGSYVTTTIGGTTTNPTVGVAVTTQAVSGASSSVKGLAEASDVKEYVDQSIAEQSADFKGTYHIVDDLELQLTDAENENTVKAALKTKVENAGKNDYCVVLCPEHVATQGSSTGKTMPTRYDRYHYTGTEWLYEYSITNMNFTEAQMAAINSGATSTKISGYDTHVANTNIHVTAEEKEAWNEALESVHTHSNKEILDTITQAKIDAWDAGQTNVLEGVQVNGADLAISSKKVNVTVTEGTTNGTVAVNGTDVAVHGLKSAAYTDSTDYATAAQGAKADSAIQKVIGEEGITNGEYIDVAVSVVVDTEDPSKVTLKTSKAVTTHDIATAGEGAKGLAEASNVKAYVDSAVSGAMTWEEGSF